MSFLSVFSFITAWTEILAESDEIFFSSKLHKIARNSFLVTSTPKKHHMFSFSCVQLVFAIFEIWVFTFYKKERNSPFFIPVARPNFEVRTEATCGAQTEHVAFFLGGRN